MRVPRLRLNGRMGCRPTKAPSAWHDEKIKRIIGLTPVGSCGFSEIKRLESGHRAGQKSPGQVSYGVEAITRRGYSIFGVGWQEVEEFLGALQQVQCYGQRRRVDTRVRFPGVEMMELRQYRHVGERNNCPRVRTVVLEGGPNGVGNNLRGKRVHRSQVVRKNFRISCARVSKPSI